MGKTLRHFGGDILNVRGNYAYIITHHPYLGRCYSYLVLAYCHVTLGHAIAIPKIPTIPPNHYYFFLMLGSFASCSSSSRYCRLPRYVLLLPFHLASLFFF